MKTTTIEDLLSWAFLFELPKLQARADDDGSAVRSAWQTLSNYGELGTLIDRSPNHYGVIPGYLVEGDPHPDAIAVGDAVRDLANVRFDIPEGWNPLPDIEDPYGLIAAEVAAVVDEIRQKPDQLAGQHMIALVTTAAVLKRGPDWHVEPPEYQEVSIRGRPRWFVTVINRDRFGRETEVEEDGMDRKAGRPKPGAYRKYELEFPIRGDILSRLDWQLWQDALRRLSELLAPRLASHALRPFAADRQPWARA
ncbi:MAG: hypothetical protein ACK43M_22385 [Allorhizobium sp.]